MDLKNGISREKTRWLIGHLRKLGHKEIEPQWRDDGICSELTREGIPNSDLFIAIYAERWPKYSGSRVFPVPEPDKNPVSSYSFTKNKWDNTPYGDNRRELCLFIADELEKELINDTNS